ncbi:hypothetical protein OH807_17780 [Kitasatospora sp. NBC_01560]|uniref:ScbA/BarX family gamma-butyrolactone biosynthesis protein n=1 Tax=Kitasatospora sp. NBC_01560 TaxID=2975965 RepID=UPI00386D0F0F
MPWIAAPDDGPYPHPGSGYDFHDRTVSRQLVHRAAVSEVLITGWQATGPYDFLVGAQWPRPHDFHRPPGARHHDPLLLAETVRQAGLLIGHVGFGVPRDHEFALDELSYTLGPDGMDGLAVTAAPASLMLEVGCQDVRMRHGRLASLRVHAEIRRDGRPVGRAGGQLRVLTPAAYARLRGSARRGAAPGRPGGAATVPPQGNPQSAPQSTPAHPAPAPGPARQAVPAQADRDRPDGLVLGPSPVPGSWLLQAGTGHPVLFDRAADHVPGLLVLEAARQAAQQLRHPEPVLPVELVSSFHGFIELDRPCLVRAVRETDGGAAGRGDDGARSGDGVHGPDAGDGPVPVRVLLVQDGRTAAECRLLTVPAGGAPGRRETRDGRPGGPDRGAGRGPHGDESLPLAS